MCRNIFLNIMIKLATLELAIWIADSKQYSKKNLSKTGY
jgi:hypothetical protein